ncbi:1-acyl-sn-glycerol-3-phosphate acyltransferase [Psychrobacillus glaciei]|uniref:1-acyl-sn-glycerol-3-phosphate acyltransferase n=1 Tax=Psychrobacillus glaciei TaxID=2283160 RepID=A0A5J6SM83_9BACI|nr:lysophospholipid acyltransferase family protein [Psychrobacillus glaciei]QFF99051.1 1-acyl-sn-glycerol-3-phosphate acyltransferase [Psychrobacillus glaciei]
MYHFTLTIAKLIVRLFGKVEVKNKHLLPQDEGYIVTCTHRGWLEILILGICVPKPIHFMAKKELFDNKLIGYFLRKINAFPVDRENPSPSSIKKPVKLLRSGEIVGIFPSGTRTSEDVSLKRGAVTIGNLSRAPIVPALYAGPRTLKELRKMKKATIIFGEPIYVRTSSKEELATYTELLNKKTMELEIQIEKV